ncbi:hypothetical protein AVEN_157944-1 [Araneus ventricosus]|uniref:Uncharacterized protein n=1 Tax=Araneus ventricosus TaxID=182803 RepID=A0A4Y2IRT9_ARAVE|nr:hypothetical protein AVEN_157944-1 [Araneus ventricosus]
MNDLPKSIDLNRWRTNRSLCQMEWIRLLLNAQLYCSTTDSVTRTFGQFYTGKRCQEISHMRAFPEFFVRSGSAKCKQLLLFFTFPHFDENNSGKQRRVSESVAKKCNEK